MALGRLIIRRVGSALFTVWGAVTLVFLVIRLAPGDPAQLLLGDFASPETLATLRTQLGLDQSLYVQYFKFLANIVTGNFGESFATGRPVMAEVLRLFPYTLTLAAGALVVDVLLGLPAGILAALRPHTWIDRLVMVGALVFVSMPAFWGGLLLLAFFSVHLQWFPVIGAGIKGDLGSTLWHLVLPAITLGASRAAFTARMTRSQVLDVINHDYVRTARAKGMPSMVVVYRHVLRNALIQVVTVLAINLGAMIGGSVVVETVFVRPGLGKMLVDSIIGRDYMQVQASILFFAVLLVSLYLVVDLAYAWLDPRVRYD